MLNTIRFVRVALSGHWQGFTHFIPRALPSAKMLHAFGVEINHIQPQEGYVNRYFPVKNSTLIGIVHVLWVFGSVTEVILESFLNSTV